MQQEACPGCHALSNPADDPTHRYIGASPACWDLCLRLLAGEPPMATSGPGVLLVDAYASQHPGDRSPQATQSVAVHLVVLDAILGRRARHEDAIRIRVAAVEHVATTTATPVLEPEPAVWDLTLQDVVDNSDAGERAEVTARYAETVWSGWRKLHSQTIADWYKRVSKIGSREAETDSVQGRSQPPSLPSRRGDDAPRPDGLRHDLGQIEIGNEKVDLLAFDHLQHFAGRKAGLHVGIASSVENSLR